MKAILIRDFGGRNTLCPVDLPVPQAEKGEVLINVKAAGVNPVDCAIREGRLVNRIPHQLPLIPGWDVAGIVADVGPEVRAFCKGDEVFAYCRKPVVQWGAYAEYIVLPEEVVARKPSSLSFEEAASVPLAALTAYQVLFEAVDLRQNDSMLVHAAAGGVGIFAVQLAVLNGARVLGTARRVNHDFVLSLGAEAVVDYSLDDFERASRNLFSDGVDGALDSIGGSVTLKTMETVRPGGVLVSIKTPRNPAVEARAAQKEIRFEYVFVRPDAKQLSRLAKMFDERRLKTHISAVLPLEQAALAHEMIETGHTRGKIVLKI